MEKQNAAAKNSFVLGIISLAVWCLWWAELPVAIVEIVKGYKGLNSENRNHAVMGIIFSAAGIALAIIFLFVFLERMTRYGRL